MFLLNLKTKTTFLLKNKQINKTAEINSPGNSTNRGSGRSISAANSSSTSVDCGRGCWGDGCAWWGVGKAVGAESPREGHQCAPGDQADPPRETLNAGSSGGAAGEGPPDEGPLNKAGS